MKYLIILGDGMADEPIPRLGGRTPLQAARKPTIDRIAALGASGILDTVPEGFAPGSEIAHLSLLGYDVPSVFEGRGSLEAAGMGVEIGRGEMVMRCNLITVEQERIRNHTAGNISTDEAAEQIDFLHRRLGGGRASRTATCSRSAAATSGCTPSGRTTYPTAPSPKCCRRPLTLPPNLRRDSSAN